MGYRWAASFLVMACSMYRSCLFPLDPADFLAVSWGRPEPLNLKTMYSCPESEKDVYRKAIWFPHQLLRSTGRN
jgi:hypothetical protein